MRGSLRTAAAGLLALAATGCGIQSVDVPVDAGPAPSRATCDAPSDTGGQPGTELYLVCGSRVERVTRPFPFSGEETPASSRATIATALLTALQGELSDEERAAGFTTAVPGGLRVIEPMEGDPHDLVRLSQHPKNLPAFALVQVICTFANADALGNESYVLLAGPPDEDGQGQEPGKYPCAESMRNRPESAHTEFTPLTPPRTTGSRP
ncbi:hypothetical protein [Streptomyces aidingensis]|uniref:Lipoprotein n=1 Tax=Streptomyces aidingensis TaxID=910347 RepID=A0A1I1EJK7_9ACTN|nr:hypothetical protein [Streptomyces aidingensis]SFB86802.1 hypothetical protein SAMN05421773_101317 [Streptomyces aidingensis]